MFLLNRRVAVNDVLQTVTYQAKHSLRAPGALSDFLVLSPAPLADALGIQSFEGLPKDT